MCYPKANSARQPSAGVLLAGSANIEAGRRSRLPGLALGSCNPFSFIVLTTLFRRLLIWGAAWRAGRSFGGLSHASVGRASHRPEVATTTRWMVMLRICVVALAGVKPAAAQLVVAQIGALQEKPVPEVVQLGEGMKAFFASANERGGVNGQRIEFVQFDDALDPDRFVRRFEEAIKLKPVALLSPFGSSIVQRMLDAKLLDGADTIVINAVPGAEAFRNPGHPKLFHVRAGDGQQIEKIVRHVKTLGIVRLGILYADTPGGRSAYVGAQEAAGRESGLSLAGFKSASGTDALGGTVRTLASSDVQSAIVTGPPQFIVEAVAAMRAAGFTRSVFTLSYLVPAELVRSVKDQARGVGISQVFPNPMGVVLPLQREFHTAMRKAYPLLNDYSAFHLEGFVCAKLLVEVAQRAKQRSAVEYARTLRAMGDVDLGGFRVDFSRGAVGSRFVDIGIINATGQLTY